MLTGLVAVCGAALAAGPQYADARAVAEAHDLTYVDLSRPNIHACKLVGKGHAIFITAELPSLLIDDAFHPLPYPTRRHDGRIQIEKHAVDLIARTLGANPAVALTVPPRPVVRPRVTRRQAEKFTVVLDPGHGGRDPGAHYGNVSEKTIVLDIAKRVRSALETDGARVVMTRARDVAVDLDRRVEICQEARADLFVSIHADAATDPDPAGSMTLYPPRGPRDEKPEIYERARREVAARHITPSHFEAGGSMNPEALAAVAKVAFESNRWLSIDVAGRVQDRLVRVSGTHRAGNGVVEDYRGLRVLSKMHCPAVLVEVDFLSNPERRRKLKTATYRAAIARAIAGAILEYRDAVRKE
jgi:N-acetylmuramoyl-L-alanine amidase